MYIQAMATLIAYTRASTSKQQVSPEYQLREIHQWAERQGHTIAGSFTECVSGTAPMVDRPGWRMLYSPLTRPTAWCAGM
ncbi:MAG: hypothetical protein CMN30_27730 [Sandaracinus sp.]|nr:hypothetical protein [Sandaracinus sp.]